MKLRSRKRQRCKQSLGSFVPKVQKKVLKSPGLLKKLRAIEPNVVRVFGCDRRSALLWFITPAIGLDGWRPLDLVESGRGQILLDYLCRLEFGVYT